MLAQLARVAGMALRFVAHDKHVDGQVGQDVEHVQRESRGHDRAVVQDAHRATVLSPLRRTDFISAWTVPNAKRRLRKRRLTQEPRPTLLVWKHPHPRTPGDD